MQLPFKKFILATGKTDELNRKVKFAAYIVISDYPASWPSKIILERETIKDTAYDAPDLKGWYDGMGSVIPIEIVDGDIIKVEKEIIQ